MNDTERLIAIDEIRQMRARYLRLLDTRQLEEAAKHYAPDGTLAFHTELPGVVMKGPAEVQERLTTLLVDVQTVHYATTAEITIISPTAAKGIWAFEDYLFFGPKSAAPGQKVHGFGHLVDEYVKIDGRWKFKSAEITRLCPSEVTQG